MASQNPDLDVLPYLSFTIAGTDYGFPILAVKEILQFEEATRIPGAPPSIRGVVNVRGQVVPVVDLSMKFGGSETVVSKRTCILVVEVLSGAERRTLGVLADAVNEVLDLPASAIEEPPAFGANVRIDYVIGMGKVGRRFVLLLDADRVLTAPEAELTAQATALAGTAEPAPSAPA